MILQGNDFGMIKDEEFQQAVELIGRSKDVLITCHTRPDGDACGSMQAMSEALREHGKRVRMLLLSPLPRWYQFMFSAPVPVLGNDITLEQMRNGAFASHDLVIVVDTDSYIQLPEFDAWLRDSDTPVLVIDHHMTGDGIGALSLIDKQAAAAGEIVYDLLRYAGWAITPAIAEALFIALATDTGWFRFANADSRLFRQAADLIDAGANPAELNRRLYQNFSAERMSLLIRVLQNMELYYDNRVAFEVILRKDFDETGATGRDTENLINEAQRVASVEVAALFVELADGGFRCSLRSKGLVDVQAIAQKYGGGGHKMAAGVNLEGPLEAAKERILRAVASQLGIGAEY